MNLLETEKIKTSKSNAPTVTIIGDSMIKKFYSWQLSRQRNRKQYVVVWVFVGAKTQFMDIYKNCKMTLKPAPKLLSVHCRTNNLPSNEVLETVVKNFVNLSKNIKTDTTKVIFLGIMPRRGAFNLKTSK